MSRWNILQHTCPPPPTPLRLITLDAPLVIATYRKNAKLETHREINVSLPRCGWGVGCQRVGGVTGQTQHVCRLADIGDPIQIFVTPLLPFATNPHNNDSVNDADASLHLHICLLNVFVSGRARQLVSVGQLVLPSPNGVVATGRLQRENSVHGSTLAQHADPSQDIRCIFISSAASAAACWCFCSMCKWECSTFSITSAENMSLTLIFPLESLI